MAKSAIRQAVKQVVDRFHNGSSRDEAQTIIREAQALVQDFYAQEMGAGDAASLPAAAARDPEQLHALTQQHFGFEVYQQPSYRDIDDYAWESSQRYTTLKGVDLPDNAVFFDSNRRKLDKAAVFDAMEDGEHHLFDIALSNEYVLLGKNEKFSVNELESRFSTNNEHLAPQSKARQEGNVKVFKSDPRMIIISDIDNNGARGNLQVVFNDGEGNPRRSVSLLTGAEYGGAVLVESDFSEGQRQARYNIGPEDAPHYAYALALAHFAGGFSAADDRSWFDKAQAQEVAKMLHKLAENPVDQNKEPVIRDVLSDAKVLEGNINPVALVPAAFAEGLEAEIGKGKFRSRLRTEPARPQSHVEALRARESSQAAMGM